MGKLAGTRMYLCGAIDRVPNSTPSWREEITPFLKEMDIYVINPQKKPINIGLEDAERRVLRQRAKALGDFEALEKDKIIRIVDLRSVDISDAIIVNLDMDHKPFGTIEEITLANRQKKPILVANKGGKIKAPDWLFWMIGHEFIFNDMEEIKEYLTKINMGQLTHKRWIIFDFIKG